MKYKARLLALLSVLTVVACAEPDYSVTFTMHSPALKTSTNVFLVGDHEVLGAWQPQAVAMTYLVDQTWTATVNIPVPDNATGSMIIEYRYVLEDPNVRAALPNGFLLPDLQVEIDGNINISDSIPDWIELPKDPVSEQAPATEPN